MIDTALLNAKVAVLLVSKNFLASEFIQNKELPKILQQRKDKNAAVLWIPLEKDLAGEVAAKLADIQAAYPPHSPLQQIVEQSTYALETAREQIREQIRRALDPMGW